MQPGHFNIAGDLLDEVDSIPLSPEGEIPSWLSGTLIRNGPVTISVNGESLSHWFDGLAMLHAFSFGSQGITYTNKFLRTEAYKSVFEKGSIHYMGFATDPCRTLFKRLFTWFVPHTQHDLPNANINVAQLTRDYVALHETPLPVRFDPVTLDTLGVFEYEDKLPQEKCWESAHPHFVGNEMINYLIEYGNTSHYTLYKLAKNSQKRRILARIPSIEPSYMHSFSVTENYAVFTEYPFVVKPLEFVTKGKPFIENFSWKPERGTRFTVVNRHTGIVQGTYHTKPFFSFHHANAFEQENHLYIDILCYDDAKIIYDLASYAEKPSKQREEHKVRVERFSLNLDLQYLSSEILLTEAIEFPRINPAFDARPYRFLYLTDPRDPFSAEDYRPLYKLDTTTREEIVWSEPGCYPGEPVFVANPGSTEEDDGVILSLVLTQNTSFLLILNASTFKEIARAAAPHQIPPGLHGQFFSSTVSSVDHQERDVFPLRHS